MTEDTRQNSGSSKIKAVGIVAKARLPEAPEVVGAIKNWLYERNVTVMIETETADLVGLDQSKTFSRSSLPSTIDLLVVLGGDGTLLGIARSVAELETEKDIPILAINFGSLGFLTEITLPELYQALESIIDGTADIDERQMLRSRVIRDTQTIADRVVLNDVVVSKSALSSIIDLTIGVGDQFVTQLRSDGLIIASPTGSTAYSMAAGGPIVHPLVDALVITPIAPHTLTNRPIVIPSNTAVRITPTLSSSHHSAYVSFDGQSGLELNHGDTITVERGTHALKVIRAKSRGYFAVLHEKLKWGQR